MLNPLKFLTKIHGRDEIGAGEEGVEEIRQILSLDLDDKELVKIINSRLKDAQTIKDKIDKINEQNENFYLGNQVDTSKLYDHQSKIVDNRIFLAVDTIVPILATKKREPIVFPAQRTDESRELALITQDYLSWKWGEQKMNLKLADTIKLFNIHRFAVLKYRFVGGIYNDFKVEVKRPESIIIDNKPDEEDIEFIGEYLKDSVKGIIERFYTVDGKVNKVKKDKLLRELGIDDSMLDSKVSYIEFWTNEFVVWKINNIILDKAKNPNWLWDEKKFNHFNQPQKPYVILTWNNLKKGTYGDTTLLEQAIPIQKNLNKRKRQIADNADQANGTWVFNSKYIPKKEVVKFTGAPNEHIVFNGDGTVNDAVGRLFPKDLGQQVFLDQQDDKSEIDNIMGVHATTRGERTSQKTLGEAQLLKQSDYGRLDLVSQYLDVKMEELYNAFIQMSLVYYDEMKTLKILGAENSQKYIDFTRDNIEEGIEVIVKGEPLLAKAEEMEKYMLMFQSGLIDPLTMYERLNLPNPKELTMRKLLLDIDPKAYLAQYAMDENTPGMENEPTAVAKKDIRLLEKGEEAPPAAEVTKEHIAEHTKHLKSSGFKRLKPQIKMNVANHMRSEIESIKQTTQQIK